MRARRQRAHSATSQHRHSDARTVGGTRNGEGEQEHAEQITCALRRIQGSTGRLPGCRTGTARTCGRCRMGAARPKHRTSLPHKTPHPYILSAHHTQLRSVRASARHEMYV
jgi:hypothetical protein